MLVKLNNRKQMLIIQVLPCFPEVQRCGSVEITTTCNLQS